MAETAQFFVFIALPSLVLLAAIGLSANEIYRIGEYRLLVVIVLLGVMLQHQLLEWSSFWARGLVTEPALGEVFETTANLIAATGVYYLLALLGRERSLTAELDRREREFKALVDSAPTPMLYHCPKEIRLVNDAAVSMLEADSEDALLGRSLTEFVEPEDRGTVEAAISPGGNRGTGQSRQITLESVDGNQRYVVFSAEPIQFDGRDGIQITLNDVTERERSRQQLEATKDRFQTLFHNIQHGVLVIDPEEQTFLDANEQACEMLGYERTELLDLDPADIHPHEIDRFETFIESARTQESLVTEGLSCRRKDGRQFSAEVAARPIRMDGRTALLVSVRDITERNRRKRQIGFLNRLFRHNVRNRVNVLIGNAEVIKQRGNEDIADIAEVIHSVGQRFVETSEKIRQMTDVLKDGVDQEVEQTNLSDIVETILSEHRAQETGATFKSTIETDVVIRGDDSIRIAIDDLIENAVEHAGDQPEIDVTVQRDYADTGRAQVVITDDGPGIPDNERVVVTNPDAQTPLEHGSGLGLHLVAQTVGVYGGEFDLETPDAEEIGTRAVISLPLVTETPAPWTEQSTES